MENVGIYDPNRTTTSNAGNPLFRGLIDEVKVYTNAFTVDQIQQAQLGTNVIPVAASIITQPANQTADGGRTKRHLLRGCDRFRHTGISMENERGGRLWGDQFQLRPG